MQTVLNISTRTTGVALPVGTADNRSFRYAAVPASGLRSRRVLTRIAAQQGDKQVPYMQDAVKFAVALLSQTWCK